jgi:phosphatidylinositol-3-phosphatase
MRRRNDVARSGGTPAGSRTSARAFIFAAAFVAALYTQGFAARPAQAAFAPPPIKHVWLVQLENLSFDESITNNPNHFLSRVLPASGNVLTQYYGIGHFSLDNYIAQISGQAPNPETQGDCQFYHDVSPGTLVPNGTAQGGQATGQGCVYPSTVLTLADQLTAQGMTWKGYVEDMGNNTSRDTTATCAHPALNTQDGTQKAASDDQYAARHNPFVYFHSIIDNAAACAANDVALPPLAADLQSVSTTPDFSFIVPNLCNDAHDATCTGPTACGAPAGGTGGLVAADCWLQTWIPRIIASPAYKQDGMVIVTFDESNTLGSGGGPGDAASCCGEQGGPGNPALPGQDGPGGGHISMVILSRWVKPGTTSATPYNHYALLRSLEDLYGVTTGGSDGQGHLGFAGQSGLAAFGADVYNNPGGGNVVGLVPTPTSSVTIPGLSPNTAIGPPNAGAWPDGGPAGPLALGIGAVVAGIGVIGFVARRPRRPPTH